VSGGCSGPSWQQHVEPQAWPALLHQAGYITFYAGKYLNQVSVGTHVLLFSGTFNLPINTLRTGIFSSIFITNH
jgi:hypothetical protein